MTSPQPSTQPISLLHQLIHYLTLIYLLRFPFLTGIFLIAFPIIAYTFAAELLENLFDLDAQGVLWTTTTTFLAAWSVMVTASLALTYAPHRVNLGLGRKKAMRGGKVVYFSLLALPVLAGVLWKVYQLRVYEPKENLWLKASMIPAGFLFALVLLIFADLIRRLVDSPYTNSHAPELLLSDKTPVIGLGLKRASIRPSLLASNGNMPTLLRKSGQLLMSIPHFLGKGYIDYSADPTNRFPLLGGHGAAFALLSVFLIFYAIIGLAAAPSIRWFHAPALAYLLIWVTILNWVLSGLAFFFDRYRIPVLMVIVAWSVLSARVFTRSDSYYYIYKNNAATESKERADSRIIVVAANGGGIQSAAWTARVLSGLAEIGHELNQEPDNVVTPDGQRREISFAKHVHLLSAVSGGSVGAMYFADAYGVNGDVEKKAGDKAFNLAARSSLSGVAWGLVFPDFIRSLMPLLYWKMDRGGALELEWKRTLDGRQEEQESLNAMLSDWRRDAEAGKRPGVIFNSTIVDSGQPMLFTTVDFADHTQSHLMQWAEIFGRSPRYLGYDIPVTTAARLSATFPYVTPASRAIRNDKDDWQTREYHVVDGGYYDNFGVASLAAWLDAKLRLPNSPIKDVLIIKIYGEPVGGERKPETSFGGLYQALAPFFTLYRVRGAGQLAHSTSELDMLERYWEKQGKETPVNIELVTFAYPDAKPPLSWHLTSAQIQNIKYAWEKMRAEPDVNIKQVKCFLKGGRFDGRECVLTQPLLQSSPGVAQAR
jgi:Patatin-like phospholipase